MIQSLFPHSMLHRVRGNKNDHNDAFAIAEASERSHIRFVPIKSEQQQEISCLHRIREKAKGSSCLINKTLYLEH